MIEIRNRKTPACGPNPAHCPFLYGLWANTSFTSLNVWGKNTEEDYFATRDNHMISSFHVPKWSFVEPWPHPFMYSLSAGASVLYRAEWLPERRRGLQSLKRSLSGPSQSVIWMTVLPSWTTLSESQRAFASCGPVRRCDGCGWCRSTLCSWQAQGCPGVWGKTSLKSHKVAYRPEDTHQRWQMASPRLHAWQGERPEQSSKSSVFTLQNKAIC